MHCIQGTRSNLPCPNALHKFVSGQHPDENKYDIGTSYKLWCPDASHNFGSGQNPYMHKNKMVTR